MLACKEIDPGSNSAAARILFHRKQGSIAYSLSFMTGILLKRVVKLQTTIYPLITLYLGSIDTDSVTAESCNRDTVIAKIHGWQLLSV